MGGSPTTICFIILLLLQVPHASSLGLEETPGDSISDAQFQARFPHLPVVEKGDRVFEITADKKLIGSNFHVDLIAETRQRSQIFGSDPNAVVMLNGDQTISAPLTVRTGPEYTIAIDEHDAVLFVTGNDLDLVPFGHGAERKFVNVLVVREEGISFDDMDEVALTPDDASAPVTARQEDSLTNCVVGAPTRILELAVATDATFCAAQGGSAVLAEARVRFLLAQASQPFRKASCLRLYAEYIELHCDEALDPYASFKSLGAELVLHAMRKVWNEERTMVNRDLALLLTGFEAGSTTLGAAFLGTVCSLTDGFAWVDSSRFPVSVLVHELGHSLGLTHSSSGIMSAFLNPYQRSELSPESSKALRTYLSSSSATCITKGNLVGENGNTVVVQSVLSKPSATPTASAFVMADPSASPSAYASLPYYVVPPINENSHPTPSTSSSQSRSPRSFPSKTPKASQSRRPQPSKSRRPRPSSSRAPRPSSSRAPKPSSSRTPRPSSSRTPRPSSSRTPRPSASRTPRPSSSRRPRPSASRTPRPSSSRTPRPSKSKRPAPTTTNLARTCKSIKMVYRTGCFDRKSLSSLITNTKSVRNIQVPMKLELKCATFTSTLNSPRKRTFTKDGKAHTEYYKLNSARIGYSYYHGYDRSSVIRAQRYTPNGHVLKASQKQATLVAPPGRAKCCGDHMYVIVQVEMQSRVDSQRWSSKFLVYKKWSVYIPCKDWSGKCKC